MSALEGKKGAGEARDQLRKTEGKKERREGGDERLRKCEKMGIGGRQVP